MPPRPLGQSLGNPLRSSPRVADSPLNAKTCYSPATPLLGHRKNRSRTLGSECPRYDLHLNDYEARENIPPNELGNTRFAYHDMKEIISKRDENAVVTPTEIQVEHHPSAPDLSLNESYCRESNYKAGTCFECGLEIKCNQRVVRTKSQMNPSQSMSTASSSLYRISHIDCFCCHKCNMSLEHSQFYISARDSHLYCHLDYHEIHSPRCGYCHTPIENKGIVALDKSWHEGHFFCHGCSKPFTIRDDFFIENKSSAWCSECYAKKTAVKCWKCNHIFQDSQPSIEALDRLWCSYCFSCEECTKPFKNNGEFVLRQDGTLVCNGCEISKIKNEIWR